MLQNSDDIFIIIIINLLHLKKTNERTNKGTKEKPNNQSINHSLNQSIKSNQSINQSIKQTNKQTNNISCRRDVNYTAQTSLSWNKRDIGYPHRMISRWSTKSHKRLPVSRRSLVKLLRQKKVSHQLRLSIIPHEWECVILFWFYKLYYYMYIYWIFFINSKTIIPCIYNFIPHSYSKRPETVVKLVVDKSTWLGA